MKISLSKAASVMNGELIGEEADFCGVGTDTRSFNSGDIFFAIKGANFNGEAFVERAFEAGACAAVLTRHQQDLSQAQIIVDDVTAAFGRLANYRRNLLSAKVVAITGSCGKTSVKGMVRSILELQGHTAATHANFNNQIGVPLTLFACDEKADYLVVEAGTSIPGEIEYLTSMINPDVSVVVNVHPAHIQGFGTLDAIAWEKSKIYSAGEKEPVKVVNAAFLKYEAIRNAYESKNAVLFSNKAKLDEDKKVLAQVSVSNVVLTESACAQMTIHIEDAEFSVTLSVPGEHQIENALAASACAFALGVSHENIARGLNAFTGVNGRMATYDLEQGCLIDDSYNASPASMKAAIDLLGQKSNTILVLGDMGELGKQAAEIHRELGVYAAEAGITQLICKGAFADDYCDGFGAKAKKCSSFDEVVDCVKSMMSDDTTILVKGSRSTKMDTVCRTLISAEEKI